MFTNPLTSATYTWEFNPTAESEQPFGKIRQIERTSNTSNVGSVKQQGDDGPLIIDWMVNAFTSAMETALWEWYVLCRTQTIYVTDWTGEQYEGQIILMTRQRHVASAQY